MNTNWYRMILCSSGQATYGVGIRQEILPSEIILIEDRIVSEEEFSLAQGLER